jgi:hypothetical protein
MNYVTDCLEQMDKLLLLMKTKLKMPKDFFELQAVCYDLMAAKKFLLPPPNALNVKATLPALKFLRLPYKVCAFEYSCPHARDEGGADVYVPTAASTRRIALVYDARVNSGPVLRYRKQGFLPQNAQGVLVLSFYYADEKKMWIPSMGAAYIDEEIAGSTDHGMLIDNQTLKAYFHTYPFLTEMIADTMGHMPPKDQHAALTNDVAEELCTAIRACLLLNTRNLKVVQASEAPEKLNKKRKRNKRIPFFDYYTLDIFVSEGAKRVDRKKVNFGAIRDMFTNTSSERRWGTVIGHFKTRATGIFWWNDHGRGNKAKGIVSKDYVVIEKDNA